MKTWIAIALVSVGLSATGCKQGIGDRCQINDDCSSGTCSPSEKVCVEVVPVDSEIVTPPIDAQIDAPPDSSATAR